MNQTYNYDNHFKIPGYFGYGTPIIQRMQKKRLTGTRFPFHTQGSCACK